MAELRMVLGHDPARLLEHAADGFLAPPRATLENPWVSPGYLLALRQGGLRDDLIALAAARGVKGWFDPPLCVFHELPEWLGATRRRPFGDYERIVLLSSVLRRTARKIFGRVRRPEAYLDAVDRFFGELIAEGVAPDAFGAALARGEDRDVFERQRDAELSASYRAYVHALEDAGRRDERDTLVDCALAVESDPNELRQLLGGRREIRLFGLQDLRGGWRRLLRALVGSPALDAIVIYTSQSLELGDGLAPEITRLDEAPSIASRLFSGGGRGEARITLIAAPDVERELEHVAVRVRRLADSGVPLSRIAIVSRQARPYVDLAVSALERVGVPATARRRVAYEEIPVVRAVLSLFAAAAEGWSRHGLAELAEQPYIGCELDAHVINHVGYRRRLEGLAAWSSGIRELEREAEAYERRRAAGEEEDEHRKPPPPLSRVRAAREAFDAFAHHAEALDRTRTLGDWIEWLLELVRRDPWGIGDHIYAVPDGQVRLARVDVAGWDGLRAILDQWEHALTQWGGIDERLGVAEFSARLRDMLVGDVALWTETQRGVQVIEGLASAYRAFDHVFIVGLEAGRFPLRAPRSPILDDADREALASAGLPLDRRDDWNLRERELFRMLVAGAKETLTLSCARLDVSGREVIRSAFVDALADVGVLEGNEVPTCLVVTPGVPLCRDTATREHAWRVARMERIRQTGVPSPYNGLIEDAELRCWLEREFSDNRLWSPTQLESYAKCPWSYFSARLLKAERLEEPGEDMDPSVRGSILHDALRRFYEAAAERVSGPVLLRETERGWAEPLLVEALDAAIAEASETVWLGNPALYDARRAELRRLLTNYIAFEIEHNEKLFNNRTNNAYILRTGVVAHELRFSDMIRETGGVRFRFRGSIDRVERGVDERVSSEEYIAAVDYKTSQYTVPGGNDGKSQRRE